MFRNRVLLVLGLLLIASMVLSACGPQATPTSEVTTTQAPAATEAPTEAPSTGRAPTIRFAVLSDMTSTNVWALFDDTDASYWNYAVQGGYWPTLYTLSDQRFDFIPATADGFPTELTQEGDFYVGTAKIKPGLKWSDGSELTADDVVFTVQTALQFKLGLNWQSAYDPNFLDHAEAVDAHTVKFYFTQSPGLAVWQYGALQGTIVNKAYWESKVADAVAMLPGADVDPASEDYTTKLADAVDALHKLSNDGEPTFGAWKFSRWEVGAFSENVINENNFFIGSTVEEFANGAYKETYADGTDFTAYGDATGDKVLDYKSGPYFDSSLYTLYDQDAAVLALRNNDVDFILNPSGLSQGFVAQLSGDSNIKIANNKQNGFRYLAFNNEAKGGVLANVALHQALACVIDVDFITQKLLQGQAEPVYTLVPEGNGFWHNKDVTKFCVGDDTKTRTEKAVQILKDAGYTWTKEPAWNEDRGGSVDYGEGLKTPEGTAFPEISLLAPSAGYDPLRATAAVYVEQYARSLGIPVTAELTNFNNILTAVYDTGDYDMFILGWGLSIYPDYICTFFDSGAGTDPYHYKSDTLKSQCDQFLGEQDINKAQTLAFQIQDTLATELPYIILFTTPIYDAYRNVDYPYTDVLDGIGSGLYGAPSLAIPSNQ
jgi:peptide/nickel transport system substrate-binding protein